MDFPKQNIPEKQKNEDWYKDCALSILSYHDYHKGAEKERIKDYENYMIVNGEFNVKDFEYVTDMYDITAPARLVNYPLIAPKLELLAGELVSQPLQFSTTVVNKNAIRRKNENKIAVASETLLRPIRREIEEALGMEIPDEELGQEIPRDIKEFQEKKFRDHIEEQVDVGLNFLIHKYNLKNTFKRGFYDLQIVSKSFYKTGIRNGDPYAYKIDPRTMIYHYDSSKEFIKDAKFAGTDDWFTIEEILQEDPDLDKTVVDELEKLAAQKGDYYSKEGRADYYINSKDGPLKVRVAHVQWKGLKNIKYKVSPNKYDPTIDYYKKVKDTYKAKDGEKVVSKYVTYVYEAKLAGGEIMLKHGPKKNQIRFESNYANTSLDFHGVIKNNWTGSTLSLVDSMKNLQFLYNITMFHIELTMARAGGKAVVYDVSQKPKGLNLDDVMFHAKNSGIIPINSQSEGYQSFNQFQQVDLTLSNQITQLLNLKMMIEQTVSTLTGVSPERAGMNKSGDLVGVNERNIMQSSLMTAPLFDLHYTIVGEVLEAMANHMKVAWANEGRMANVYGDNGMEIFKIDKAIANDEYGIFIENSGKDVQKRRELMMLLERYSSSGNIDPLTTIRATLAESTVEIEGILTAGLKEVQSLSNQMEERQIAAQEEANRIAQEELGVKRDVANIQKESAAQVQKMKNDIERLKLGINTENDQDMAEFDHKTRMQEEMLKASNAESLQNNQGGTTVNN